MASQPIPIFESPNTRKNKRDYAALNKFGLFEPNTPITSPCKKRASKVSKTFSSSISSLSTTPSIVSNSLSHLDTDIQPSQSISQVQYEVNIDTNKESTRVKERSWIWKYYHTTPEPGSWKLGNKERPEL